VEEIIVLFVAFRRLRDRRWSRGVDELLV
jgi:hypothetical protein